MLLTPRTRSVALLIQPVRRPWNWRIFLPRYESLFQRRQKLIVPRPRLPHHPAVIAGIVHRALLLLDLVRTVRRLAEAECLEPGTHVLAFDAELLVTLACA